MMPRRERAEPTSEAERPRPPVRCGNFGDEGERGEERKRG